ncbi:GTPase Era [Actinospica sp.]|jgi:GTP-binding protein Era|uniref:GTPase Era n=1 Tax=Actinospica sp. TaxID=1872142 RepID=UPI002C69DAA0|nr:GTPase Era [Actinospica sp.]HWG23560.1 GTPase Era [Actinospica sp.]
MTEPRRTSSSSEPRKPASSQAGRNAVRNNRGRKAEELENAERRKRQSIAKAERRTTSEQVRASEPAPTAVGRAPEGAGAATPSYLDIPDGYRAGFACFVGRPNAGKSTLTNALVGAKIAITSGKPQTTRHTVRGIVHRPDAQLVLVDTPGLHRPRTLLGERLNEQVRATWAEVDVIGFCIPANQEIGPGDRYIAQQLAQVQRTPKVAIVTKTDTMGKQSVGEQLLAVLELGKEIGIEWAEIVPVSAVADSQVGLLADLLVTQLPQSPPLYPGGELTDEPEQVMVGELIREAALEGVRDELPHSLAVTVEEMLPRKDRPKDKPLLDVHATLYVERSSQKSIVIGTGGSRLREVGTRARQQIEALLGTPVFLDLHVKVAKDWQRDPKQLQRLGF